MLAHTPAMQGHTAPSAYVILDRSTHLGSHNHPEELPKAPPPHTQPQLYGHTQEPLTDTGITTATHHGLPHGHPLPQPHTHWCACTYIIDTVTHTNSHMHLLRTVTVSHMDTIIYSEESIFLTDTTSPPKTQNSPVTLSLSYSYTQQWKIHRYTFRTVTLCWDLGLPRLFLGGRE